MTMDHESNLDQLPEHRALLERAVAYFRADDRVTGLILGGSLARGGVDIFSDVDLYIVVRDEEFDAIFAERDIAAETTGAPLFRFVVDPVPGGSRDYIVTYQGPIKVDFMYLKESDLKPAPKWAGCPVLKDATGSLATLVARSANAPPPTFGREELKDINQKFWTWCWYVFGKIMRGELWEAVDGIHSIRTLALVPLLDWMAGRPHEGYRRLENKLDRETASRLRATVVAPRVQSLYAALQAEISLFRDLRAVVCDSCKLTLDTAPEETIQAEMERRWIERVGNNA
jgi:predicted nucleotidyltransferase